LDWDSATNGPPSDIAVRTRARNSSRAARSRCAFAEASANPSRSYSSSFAASSASSRSGPRRSWRRVQTWLLPVPGYPATRRSTRSMAVIGSGGVRREQAPDFVGDDRGDRIIGGDDVVAQGGVDLRGAEGLLRRAGPSHDHLGADVELLHPALTQLRLVRLVYTIAAVHHEAHGGRRMDPSDQVEIDLGLSLGGAVVGADRDGEGIHAGRLVEGAGLLGLGQRPDLHGDPVLGAADRADLALDGHAAAVGELDHAAGLQHVLRIGERGDRKSTRLNSVT